MSELALQLIAEAKRTKAKTLDLGNCGLTELPDELFELVGLEELYVSNRYLDYEKRKWIESKNKGTENSLSSIPEAISKLKSLQKLYLSDTQISDISALASLENLTNLDLNSNQISDISALASLGNLTNLDLRSNQISDISALASLGNLTNLDLSWNKISDISVLKSLSNLTHLGLRENQIGDISFLENLTNLTSLDLSGNQISDISFLRSLPKLTNLDLRYNQISDISALASLENLTTLYLRSNQISDISALASLENLTKLDLNYNQISDIRPLKSLIKKGIIVKLEELFFQGIGINLCNNPLETPPKEVVEQGNQVILNYFEQLEKEDNKEEYLFEAKLLIIGEGGAGKTTFARRLQNPSCKMPTTEESTHDITIDTWEFAAAIEKLGNLAIEKEPTFYANLWDFGGQEIYHSTHQFFFTRKCFYVLLADTREQKTDFNYWLNTIEQLGGEESSLLIVLNERNQHKWQLDINGYRTRFGDLIKTPKSLDLSDSTKIPALQQSIQEHLYQLPNIAQPLIASWVQIREELAKIDKNYISYDNFDIICNKHKITKRESIENISRYFTRIGVFTHFIDDAILEERIYLNSNWLVKTVYKLLNDETVKNKQGRVTKTDITSIWDKNELGREIKKLKALLHKFGLMYKVDRKDEFIIPIYLPDQQPYEVWPYQNEGNILHFRYEFDKYMPKGLMSRLIVALHDKIYDHDLVWKRGVNIAENGAKAEIVETYGGYNVFEIRIVGIFQRDLLKTITNAFDTILRDFQKLPIKKSVKCPCEECKNSTTPYFHKSQDLEQALIKKLSKRKELVVECKESYEDISITKILGFIDYEYIIANLKKKYADNQVLLKEIKNTQDLIEASDNRAELRQKTIRHHLDNLSNDTYEIDRLLKSNSSDLGKIKAALTQIDTILQKLIKQLPEKIAELIKKRLKEANNESNIKHELKVKFDILFAEYEVTFDILKIIQECREDFKNGHYFLKPD